MKSERLIGSEHLPGGDAKQERVTDVPGGASHSDFNRSFHVAIRHKGFAEQRRSAALLQHRPRSVLEKESRQARCHQRVPTLWSISVLNHICEQKLKCLENRRCSRSGRPVLKSLSCIRRS